MDGEDLLNSLEGLRNDIPDFLRDDFENLIESIRQIYELTIKAVAPSWPVDDGRQHLVTHATTLDTLHSQFSTSLLDFQTGYQGAGSTAYNTSATLALNHLKALRDHTNFAVQKHQSLANNLDNASTSQMILIGLMVTLGITLGVLIFSAGSTAPVTVPAAVGEAAGGTGDCWSNGGQSDPGWRRSA
jgi:hypothetical protein